MVRLPHHRLMKFNREILLDMCSCCRWTIRHARRKEKPFLHKICIQFPNRWHFLFVFFFAVAVHCKDTRIAVQVRTNKPFNGRIYALGRSETCNIDVVNSDAFRLDLTMGGQDCNTQSVVRTHLERVWTEFCFVSLVLLSAYIVCLLWPLFVSIRSN